MSNAQRIHRFVPFELVKTIRIAVAMLMVGTVLAVAPLSPSFAASQNELVVSLAFDGQSFTGDDPLDSGTGITPTHTPGADERGDNGVVRTHDLVGYRLDYNINEEGQTGAQILMTLPPNMTWTPPGATVSAQYPEGMFSGCLAGSTITSSGTAAPHNIVGTNDILTCNVGATDEEGSNGTVYPVAQLRADTDGQIKTLAAVLDTNEQPCGGAAICSGSVDVESSGAPRANFKKGLDVKDNDGVVIGRKANEFYPLQRNGVDGWVSLYTIEFRTFGSSILGSEPIDDSYAISFYDHFWDFPASTVFATDDGTLTGTSILEDGRTACGNYDGDGGYPAAAPGVWTCAVAGAQSVQLGLTGYDTESFTPLASGAPNSSMYSVGQIALWTPDADLQAKDPKQVTNTISQSATPPTDVGQAQPILFGGTSGPVAESTIVDNDASSQYNLIIGEPGTRSVNNWIRFMSGPFQAREYEDGKYGAGTLISVDERDASFGGIGGFDTINTCRSNGVTATSWSLREGWCGEQEVPRGKILTINAAASGFAESDVSVLDFIHQCVAIDNTHMSLIALPATYDVKLVEALANGAPNPTLNGLIVRFFGANPTTVGGYTAAPNQGPLANVFAGTRSSAYGHSAVTGASSNNDIPSSSIVVEFATATNPIRQIDDPTGVTTPAAVTQHGLTCNNDDAAGAGWVSSTDAAALSAAFDPDGDGLYQGIDRVRVRMLEDADWARPNQSEGYSLLVELDLQAQVHIDTAVDTAGQELFVFASRATGDWDPATENAPTATSCLAGESSWGGNVTTTTGWCNLSYTEDANLSPNPGGGALFYDNNAEEMQAGSSHRYAYASHADKVFIVEANIAVKKQNLDGLADIADNGEEVTFGIDVSTVGASSDELNNVILTDNLPGGYTFVRFTDDADGQCTNAGDSITCDFGDHVGGWSDYLEFVVEVQFTEAETKVTNIATLSAERADGTPISQSSQAFSRTPAPYDENAIIKAVNTIEGDCYAYPRNPIDVPLDPRPADWADRCEMIDYDAGQLLFELSLTNEGNVNATDVTFVDVFPHAADEVEAASATGVVGDGRSPETDVATPNTLSFVGFTGPDVDDVWVSGDGPAGISRDPEAAIVDTTWCDAAGGTVMNPGNGGSGVCPATNADVTAIYAQLADVGVGRTVSGTLELASVGHECDDIWTNSFGARNDRTILPIRSNDVSIMLNCEFDLALEKTIDPAFVPSTDWLTPGSSLITFLLEVTNQGDPVEDFEVTDYIDTAQFTFDGSNLDGVTSGDQALNYTWDTTDPAAPVVAIDGVLLNGETVTVPVTLVVESIDGDLANWAEISYFDSDGDPANGDSDPANIANPTWGELTDVDSTPNDDQADDAQPTGPGAEGDGELDGDGSGDDSVTGDEDDHDVEGLPLFDLELIKTVNFSTTDTVTFDITINNQGTAEAYLVDVIEYPPAGLALNAADTTAGLPAGIAVVGSVFTIDGPIAAGGSLTFPAVFDITDITEAPFRNAAEISAFDADADPANPPSPVAFDIDSTPDGLNDDDVIDHNTNNYDPDADSNLNEPTAGDEDDHDVELFTPQVRIGNNVWIDANADGVQDAGELPVAGVTVNLLDENGDPVLDAAGEPITTVTNADGEYFFDVEPGSYIIEFDTSTLPDGYVLTLADTGGDDTTDSDADPLTGQTGVIDVSDVSVMDDTDGDGILDDYTHDAGIVPPVRIGNLVFEDLNGDGVQDPTDDPVPGVTVNLLDANGDPVLDAAGEPITTTTDENGEYFFDVPPGDYIIEFDTSTFPADTVLTTQDAGSDDATDSDADPLTGQTAVFTVDPFSGITDTDGDGILDDYTHDAGLVDLIRIGNNVWIDANADGVQDEGELPVAGVTVNLLDENGDPVLDAAGEPITTTTDENGEYFFDVPPGMYIIEFDTSTFPADYVLTLANTDSDDATDSDADQLTGQTGVIDVSDPSTLTDTDGDGLADDYSHDAGLVPPVRIGDVVWIDANADGVQDPTEGTIPNVVVNLLDENGDPVLDAAGEPITTVTNADGEYFFDVPPGDYIIEFDTSTLPADYVLTLADTGGDDATDSDADPLTGQTAVFTVDPFSGITDTDGDGILDDYSHDAGVVPGVTIGNQLWLDANNDGIQDPTEAPVAGVTVNLLDENGEPVLDGAGNPITTVTNADGQYAFDVPAGLYIIEFDPSTFPAGTQLTAPNAGDDDATDSDASPANGQTGIIDVSDPSTLVDTDGDGIVDDYSHDAGLVETAIIGNQIWTDTDNDGVQDPGEAPVPGVVVNLLDESGNPVLDPNGDPITTVTDENGHYAFEVPAGDYIIEVDVTTLPPGTGMVPPNTGDDDTVDSDFDPVTGLTGVIPVDPSTLTDTDDDGIADNYTIDGGVTSGIEIGDTVWIDSNGDGIQDPDEEPIAGVIVTLLDDDGNPVLDAAGNPISTTTDENGEYVFIVEPGTYQIQFTVPAGYAPTTANAGDDDGVDSDTDPFGRIPAFTITPAGGNDYTLDMGVVPTQVISGIIFADTDDDGIQGPGETPIPNSVIELLDENGDPVLDVNGDPITTTTGPDGTYEFEVPPGDYQIRVTPPGGDVEDPSGIITVPIGDDVPGIDTGVAPSATNPTPSGPLAFSGMSTVTTVTVALGLLLVGMAMLLAVRRRKTVKG